MNTCFPLRNSNISRNIMQTQKNIEYVTSIHPPFLFMAASGEESASLNIDLSHRTKTKHTGLNDTVEEDGDNFNAVFLFFGFVWWWAVEEEEPSQENPQLTIFMYFLKHFLYRKWRWLSVFVFVFFFRTRFTKTQIR